MKALIDHVLKYSRVHLEEGPPEPANLSALLDRAIANLHMVIEQVGADKRSGGLRFQVFDRAQAVPA
jgi:light-regulated signal transduction histidine kinase (bacteriophytochrome)